MNDTNGFKPKLKQILEHRTGRDRAITGRELASMFGHRDDRKIRLTIRELIAEGIPVASATQPPLGYFLVNTWAEARQYQASLKARLVEDAIHRRDFSRSAALYLKPAEQGILI